MCFSFPKTPERLTATERTILEYIYRHRDGFLCMSIGQLSAELHISEATISRFARHMGCSDFKHLKRIIAQQTVETGPAGKLANTLQTGNGDLLQYWMEQQHYNLEKTFALLDRGEFDRAVQALLTARRVFIFAKNASRAPAQLLEFRLRRLGLDVHPMTHGGTELLEELSAVGPEDVVVLFGFAKVSSEGRILLEQAARVGCKAVLFTGMAYGGDEEPSDAIRLFVYRGEAQAYHSMSAPVAVVDALVLALSREMGERAVAGLEALRQLKEQYGKRI